MELFDRLLANSSTKCRVLEVSQNDRDQETNRRDDPMDVDALSKGKGKGNKRLFWLWKGQQGSEQHEQCRVLELWQVWPL